MGIRENIIFVLQFGPMRVEEFYKKLHHNRNAIHKVRKKLVEEGIVIEKEVGKQGVILSLDETKLKNLAFKALMGSLPLAEKRADEILKKLNKSKPLFIKRKIKEFKKTKPKLTQTNQKNLDNIIEVINDLVNRSVALTYAQCLDYFPKQEELIKKYHKECIETIIRIKNKLEKQHKESELDLGSHLYYNIRGYNHLTTLIYLAKRDQL